MATHSSKKHVNSFSTNFFGVVGYIGSSLVWLLAIACGVLLIPTDSTSYWTEVAPGSSADLSPVLRLMLVALVVIVFWAFWYVASRILSRIVRRIAGLFTKKVTREILIKTKYYIHAFGLQALVILLLFVPLYGWEKAAVALLGLLGGVAGIIAIWIQSRLAARHRVPIARIL